MTKPLKLIMDDSMLRIDKWLSAQLPELSRSQIVRAIKNGEIYTERSSDLKARDRLPAGSSIFIRLKEDNTKNLDLKPQAMQLDIVFEDDQMIILNKPVNLSVHPGAGNNESTLVNGLLEYTGGCLSDIGGKERRGIVHRLDKDTSGLLLIAKTNRFHQAIAELFKKRKIQRIYRALVWGKPQHARGTIDAPIGRDPGNRVKMAVIADGKQAITHFRLLETFIANSDHSAASELELELYTGRTHQIRVHLAYIKLPIIGDPVYNLGRDDFNLPAQALYAAKLSFEHPFSGQKQEFEIGPPDYYQTAKKRLKAE